MIIEFGWFTGSMTVDAEALIQKIPMTNYKEWVKLFAQYGEMEQQQKFLDLLDDQIHELEETIAGYQVEVDEFWMKANREIPTHLTRKYCLAEMKKVQKHLNGANTQMKRRQRMKDLLKRRLWWT